MPIQVTMPRLSDTMEQGTVVKWNVKEGQKVASGDVVADIETDKATMELQTFDDGTVAKLAVAEGQTVKVGTVILLLAAPGESVDEASKSSGSGVSASVQKESGEAKRAVGQGASRPEGNAASTAVMEPPRRSGPSTPSAPPPPSPEPKGRVFASPLAKKIADEAGVDLNGVEAAMSGASTTSHAPPTSRAPVPAQRVPTAATVPGPAFESDVPRLEGKRVALSNMRRVIAKRLVESKTTIPHYQVTVEVDMDPLIDLRTRLNDQLAPQGIKLSVNDFLVRACALSMHQHPFVNSRWTESGGEAAIDIIGDVNIGVAIALPIERGGGLVVGTLRGADRLGLRQISGETRRLAERARSKGLSPEEMADSTFTISNLGMFGVDHFTAIINPPNVAILAVGAAMEKPVVKDGKIVVGHRMAMTMSSDHRVVDGAMAAQYLQTVKGMLERPATLLV
jgi:pyruvate dehydrogenase E2 component (dihydrolipoamide acetyltransferase)